MEQQTRQTRTGGLSRAPLEWRILGWLGIFAILYVAFYPILVILLVFFVAMLLAAILHPTTTWLQVRAHLPRIAAALILVLLIIAAVIGILLWVLPPLLSQVVSFLRQLPALLVGIQKSLQVYLGHHPALNSLFPGGDGVSRFAPFVTGALQNVEAYIAAFSEALLAFIIVVLSVIYTLMYPLPLVHDLLVLWPPPEREHVGQSLGTAIGKVRAWMGAQLIAMATVGFLAGLVVWLMGLPFPALFGVIAGLLEIVPTLGPILGALGPLFTALAVDPMQALWIVLAFTAIQQFENHVLIPVVIGGRLRMHPVPVVFAVFIMGSLFGLLGVFVAVPLMAVAQAIYEEYHEPPPAQQERAREEARTALEMPKEVAHEKEHPESE